MSTIRVLLAEDHALVRAGFAALLRSLPGIEVVAEAGDGREALRLVETHRPAVVFMDIAMSGLNGLDATAQIVRDFPQARVVILSMHANEEYVLQALRVGAAGYLLKDAGLGELELAVRAVARGETYLSPAVSKHVIADYVRRTAGAPATAGDPLTPRQREVLQLIAEGRTVKEIAQILAVSEKTVETHRAQLMARLDIHDIAGLVRYALRAGLVT
ncbi:MAG: response regulator transcription factor [Chloroflexi bacterium]|nr:response regulator transcription factor [Chloroflexota bacterium]